MAWWTREKSTAHFVPRKVCSKDRFLANDIVRAPVLSVDFWYYEPLIIFSLLVIV